MSRDRFSVPELLYYWFVCIHGSRSHTHTHIMYDYIKCVRENLHSFNVEP